MIKLIASDMDGTLLAEGAPDIDPEVIVTIRALKEKGIAFAAASGRQYLSMEKVFAPVKNDIFFIANNGGYVTYKGKEIAQCNIERNVLKEIVAYIRRQENVFYMTSGFTRDFTDYNDLDMLRWLEDGYHIQAEVVDDVLDVEDTIIKVAMFCKDINADAGAEKAKAFLGDKVQIMASGEHWVDFVSSKSGKGNALKVICEKMNVKKEETMVFGDNSNDISMFLEAGQSYAVENAREDAKRAAKYVLTGNHTLSVLKTMKALL